MAGGTQTGRRAAAAARPRAAAGAPRGAPPGAAGAGEEPTRLGGSEPPVKNKPARPVRRPPRRRALGESRNGELGEAPGGTIRVERQCVRLPPVQPVAPRQTARVRLAGHRVVVAGSTASVTPHASIAVTKAPTLRSFTYLVEPYIPLRPKLCLSPSRKRLLRASKGRVVAAEAAAVVVVAAAEGALGGAAAPAGNEEEPGSTRIIYIVPEGTEVKQGDVVCELDSAPFRDELQAENIKYLQAKARVDQARSILEVNEISLREYRDGTYLQDADLSGNISPLAKSRKYGRPRI